MSSLSNKQSKPAYVVIGSGEKLTPEILMLRLHDKIRKGNIALPSIPSLVEEINTLDADPECTIQDVAAVISKDAGVTARLVGISNSAFYHRASSKPIQSVKDALLRIGMTSATHISLTIAMEQAFYTDNAAIKGLMSRTWEQSIIVAMASQLYSKDNKPNMSSRLAYLAGLLHNIGMLPYLRMMENVESLEGDEPECVFYSKLMENSADMAHQMLTLWRFDPSIITVVKYWASDITETDHSELVDAVRVGMQVYRIIKGQPVEPIAEALEKREVIPSVSYLSLLAVKTRDNAQALINISEWH